MKNDVSSTNLIPEYSSFITTSALTFPVEIPGFLLFVFCLSVFVSRPRSCADVLAMDTASASGIYFLWLPGTDQATRMWCDMEADGGEWTMVYSYTSKHVVLTYE